MSNQITVQQAAELHETTPRQIRQWLRSGKLQGVKDGAGWMVLTAEDGQPVQVEQADRRPVASLAPKGIPFTAEQRKNKPSLFLEVQRDWGVSDRALQGEEGPRYTSAIMCEMNRRAHGLEPRHSFGFPSKSEMVRQGRPRR